MERLSVLTGDITRVEVDAIVNAANEWMLGGGGVDGAIHDAAGPDLLAACRSVPEVRPGIRCPVGEARITPGFRLPSKFVIHTVGPRWRGGEKGEPDMLAKCYRSCLTLAVESNVTSIAFPAISTGAFAYPAVDAARIAIRECLVFLEADPSIERIVLVAFGGADTVALRKAAREVGLESGGGFTSL
jgi:O-acetyl-ADP-ribose deacetylase